MLKEESCNWPQPKPLCSIFPHFWKVIWWSNSEKMCNMLCLHSKHPQCILTVFGIKPKTNHLVTSAAVFFFLALMHPKFLFSKNIPTSFHSTFTPALTTSPKLTGRHSLLKQLPDLLTFTAKYSHLHLFVFSSHSYFSPPKPAFLPH